jgi:hypothetical protein
MCWVIKAANQMAFSFCKPRKGFPHPFGVRLAAFAFANIAKSVLPYAIFVLWMASCKPIPTTTLAAQQLCPKANPVYIAHVGNDSAVYWIPNCFAPGDSANYNDSLVEYCRNIAQANVTITDSLNNIIVYDTRSFQYPGFQKNTVWYGGTSAEKCYLLNVSGTTMWGDTFHVQGTVSLLRFFFGNDTVNLKTPVYVKCDSCLFNSQWNGTNVNPQLPSGVTYVPDSKHQCD